MKNTGKTTTMIKAKFSNKVHEILNPEPKKGQWPWQVTQRNKHLTAAEKAKLFDQIIQAHLECSNELTNYLYNRRCKKRIEKKRAERGYVAKKKTTKEQYEQMNKA